MARLNLPDAPGEHPQELLSDVIPQPIGEQDARAGRQGIESRLLPAGERGFADELLKKFGGVPKPRLIDMGNGRIDRVLIGRSC